MSINQTVENVYLRQDAVQLARKHYWRLLGMLALIMLIVYGLDAGLTALGDLLLKKESQDVIDAAIAYTQEARMSSANTLLSAQTELLTSPKYLLYNLFFIIVTGLMNSGLGLGRHAQMLDTARGGKPRILGAFCRMRQCLKGWLLSLWVAFKICLWALPGIVVFFLGVELQNLGQYDLGNVIGCIGIGLVIGLTIPSALRYCLSTYILADDPDRGVRECVTLSKGLTKGRKWQCFKLGVPTVLKMLGVAYGSVMVTALVATLLGSSGAAAASIILVVLVVLMLVAVVGLIVYFSIQFDLTYALFYLKRREPAAGAPVSYWLRDHTPAAPAKAAPVSYWLKDHLDTPESPDAPAESPADSPEDTSPETNEEKENHHE